MRSFVVILLSAASHCAAFGQVEVEFGGGLAGVTQVVPAPPRSLRQTFDPPNHRFGSYLVVDVRRRSAGAFALGVRGHVSVAGADSSRSWPIVRAATVSLGPSIAYALTPVVELHASMGGTLRLREDITAGDGTTRQRPGAGPQGDLYALAGMRGRVGRFTVGMSIERGFVDGSSVRVADGIDDVYAPRYYHAAVRFGVGYVLRGPRVARANN